MNKIIMEAFQKYYRENLLQPIQTILEAVPQFEKQIKDCRKLQLDVDAFSRKFQEAQETLKKKHGDERQEEKWREVCRTREEKLRAARGRMIEAKEKLYNDIDALEASFLTFIKTHLVRTLSIETCQHEQSQDLLRNLTLIVPESGSELLLMAALCSKVIRSMNVRGDKTSSASLGGTPLKITSSPSLDDISCSLVAEQWHESNGSVAVPFGLPVSMSPLSLSSASSPRFFAVGDSFDEAMQATKVGTRTSFRPANEITNANDSRTEGNRTPPKLPERKRVDIFENIDSSKKQTGRRKGLRLSDSDAEIISRLSGGNSTASDEKSKRVSNSRGPPPPPPMLPSKVAKLSRPGSNESTPPNVAPHREADDSTNIASFPSFSDFVVDGDDSIGNAGATKNGVSTSNQILGVPPSASRSRRIQSRHQKKRISHLAKGTDVQELVDIFAAASSPPSSGPDETLPAEASDGELTPEDSDLSDEDHRATRTTDESTEKAHDTPATPNSKVPETTVNAGVRVRLDETKTKGKFVWDLNSNLWFNTQTQFFFDPKTKLYSKKPGGPFYKYNKAEKRLLPC